MTISSKEYFHLNLKKGVNPEIIISDKSFQKKLLLEFENLERTPESSIDFFNFPLKDHMHQVEIRDLLLSYEIIIDLLEKTDPEKYRIIHKGTPFYLLAMGALMIGDFEKGVFFMDAALSEDKKNNFLDQPAELFLSLDFNDNDQAAYFIVMEIRKIMNEQFKKLNIDGLEKMEIEDISYKLKTLLKQPQLRTLITSFISFIYEFKTNKRMICLSGNSQGSAEPILLHLLKGCVLFESLLKNSEIGKAIKSTTSKTLKDYLNSKEIQRELKINQIQKSANFEGLNPYSWDDLIVKINKLNQCPFNDRAIKTLWGTRNLIGHSIGWPKKPNSEEFEKIYMMILASNLLCLMKLY